MADDSTALLSDLREVTSRLAWPSERQVDYVRDLGTSPMIDELGLEFEDAYGTSRELEANGLISDRAARALDRVNEALQEIGENEWSEQALRQSETWQRVRERAAEAAHLL